MTTAALETRNCPWCRTEFDIDPAMGAFLYTCPNPDCGERVSLGSLRHPSFDPNAEHISRGFTKAAADHVYKFALAYVYGERKANAASGTLVKIGDRYFVATTGHSVPNRVDRIECVPKRRPAEFAPMPTVLRVGKSDYVDVGFIELDASAEQLLLMEAIPIDRVTDLGSGRHGVRGWLMGYPAAQQVPHYLEKGVLGFCGLCVSCEPIEPIAWGKVDVGPIDDAPGKLDAEMHMLIQYSTQEPIYRGNDHALASEKAPEPYGMSGGGLWQCYQPTPDDALWLPDTLSLIGIQASWPLKREHLKAVQVIHWLRLVADSYPDLAPELNDRYPRLQTLNVYEDASSC